ncbi:hypothetical_protein [Leishmania infantum]|uniref:Hypothetical_protein n=1 Tax=Leishmania infantum TaxID=5671 RepID=A0A6L0XNG3_LEIIN|nr:hypothetical_protein [Leishmania infantum]SUZ45435.1 hypothetical_protein [Leishmania infantum]
MEAGHHRRVARRRLVVQLGVLLQGLLEAFRGRIELRENVCLGDLIESGWLPVLQLHICPLVELNRRGIALGHGPHRLQHCYSNRGWGGLGRDLAQIDLVNELYFFTSLVKVASNV